MSTEKATPEDVARWAANGQEYLKVIDDQLEAWRIEAANSMVKAARAGTGWAGNKDVEWPVSRLVNLFMMRQLAEGVSDALTYSDMTNAAGTVKIPPPDTSD